MHSIFVSDLHLTPGRPRIIDAFFSFASDIAARAEALYILGDLFDYWVGDDDLDDACNAAVADALGQLADKGIALYLMHGNRDILLGQTFATRCRATMLADPALIDLYETRTLLMHGDTLCTDDIEYQKFRAYAHDPDNQRRFLEQPLSERRQQMGQLRADSERSKHQKSAEIMDVAVATVESTLRRFGYPRLIHGHTHRPERHFHVVDGRTCERWVLSDWYERGSYLMCDAGGCTAIAL